MNLKTWIRQTTPEERREICEQIGTTMDYLWQIAGGHSRASARMALEIERYTGVSKHDLRPDIFGPRPTSSTPTREVAQA
jgi:DNA-binding transcriptional regulator YdaS (Cro superfamily)